MIQNEKLKSAFENFHKRQYEKAIGSFEELLKDDSLESWIKNRVRQYQIIAGKLCDVSQKEFEPTKNDLFAYMNEKKYEKALDLLKSLKIPEDQALFFEAEICVENNSKARAAECLRKAIEINSDNKGYALNSPSFSSVLNDEAFAFILPGKG